MASIGEANEQLRETANEIETTARIGAMAMAHESASRIASLHNEIDTRMEGLLGLLRQLEEEHTKASAAGSSSAEKLREHVRKGEEAGGDAPTLATLIDLAEEADISSRSNAASGNLIRGNSAAIAGLRQVFDGTSTAANDEEDRTASAIGIANNAAAILRQQADNR